MVWFMFAAISQIPASSAVTCLAQAPTQRVLDPTRIRSRLPVSTLSVTKNLTCLLGTLQDVNKLRFVAARYDNCSFSAHHDLLLLNIFASLRAPCCTLRSFRPHVFGPAYSLTDSSCPTMQMKKLLGLRPSSHLLVHPSSLHSRAWRYGAQIRRNNLWSCIRHLLCASFVYLIQPFACVPLISPDYCES